MALSNHSMRYYLTLFIVVLVTACSSESTMQAMQLESPGEFRNVEALQYSQIYAEVRINELESQRFDFSSAATRTVNVSGIVLGELNNVRIDWYENFLSEPLILASQTGSFFADAESRTATIDFEYDFDYDEDGDGIDNFGERSLGQCPWIDSRCGIESPPEQDQPTIDSTENNQPTVTIPLPVMIAIPGGTFLMGSDDPEDPETERPQHSVTIAPFNLAESEVTWGQWNTCVANSGCTSIQQPQWLLELDAETIERHPVGGVAWEETQHFIAWMNSVHPGNNYRLPSEAEFEYALRANTEGKYFYGDEYSLYCTYANGSNSACQDGYLHSAPVKSFSPNPFGLFDMNGNTGEWVQDCRHNDYIGAPGTGEAWLGTTIECKDGVLRGGNHLFVPGDFRITARRLKTRHRDYVESHEGFRLASD